jgi:hypothetical protein
MDKTLNLSDSQRREIKNYLKRDEENLGDAIRRFYRLVHIPIRDGFKEIDLGIPTYGENRSVDHDVYDKLKSEEEILENVSPIVIKERYLRNKEYLKIQQIYDSMLKTPGQVRITSFNIIESSIRNGVREGEFGLGEINPDGKIVCTTFKEAIAGSLEEKDIVVNETICRDQVQNKQITIPLEDPIIIDKIESPIPEVSSRKELNLDFRIPRGRISEIMRVMNYLQTKFQTLDIQIKATNGQISEDDYANKIKEALSQLGIDLEKDDM